MNERIIFEQALDFEDADSRDAFLAGACGNDADLRQQVDSLLHAHAEECSVLDERMLPVATADFPTGDELCGEEVGNYKLLEQIGEGGMGVVFMAEQEQPIRRRVALKIIKPGMDTKQVIARFEAEQQALALMDHPNIARVFDAGSTAKGRPFFVMELVRGIPITKYCDKAKLSIPDRLKLFVTACQAVQHAHQKGIIHRDIKPSNILVTLHDGVPVPKVIDFGIAKATSQRLTEKTLFTSFSQMIGTPLYISPEQAEISGLDVDTRSDVYSLGVLLYELLTGTTPFSREQFHSLTYQQMRDLLQEVDPPVPSSRITTLKAEDVSTHSARRGIDARKFSSSVHGELDWIVMKTLEKDRARRYESPTALAADIQRHLDDEPVLARPSGLPLKFAKWSRRNRGLVTTLAVVSAVVFLALTVSTIVLSAAWRQEAEQRAIAESAKEQSDRDRQQMEMEKDVADQQKRQAIEQQEIAQSARDEMSVARNHAQQNLYKSDMRLAYRDWELGQTKRLYGKLLSHVPLKEEQDHRGWEWYYLLSLMRSADIKLNVSNAYAAVWNPDGMSFATSDNGGRIQLWDATTGERLKTIRRNGHPRGLSYNPNGTELAVGVTPFEISSSHRTRLEIVDLANGQLVDSYDSDLPISETAWSPDGKRIAFAAVGKSESRSKRICNVQIYDIENESIVRRIERDQLITGLKWHANGEVFFNQEAVFTLDDLNEPPKQYNPGHTNTLLDFAIDKSGRQIATASFDRTIIVYDRQTTETLRTLMLPAAPNCVDWHPDAEQIACGVGQTVQVWNTATGALVATFKGHTEDVLEISWSPNGTKLLSRSFGASQVYVWRIESAEDFRSIGCQTEYRGPVDWNRDGNLIMIGTGERCTVMDPKSGNVQLDLECRTAAFSPVDDRIVTATQSGRISMLDGATGMAFWKFQIPGQNGEKEASKEESLASEEVRRITTTWTFDGKYVVAALLNEDRILVFDSVNGEQVTEKEVGGIFSASRECTINQHLATGHWDGSVSIWEVPSLERLQHRTYGAKWIAQPSWSPDGSMLVEGGFDKEARILNVDNGQLIRILRGHTAAIYGLAWHPESDRIVTAGDTRIRLWNASTGSELLSLTSPIVSGKLAWSPNGQQLAMIADGILKVWDARGGYEYAKSSRFNHDQLKLATAVAADAQQVVDVARHQELSRLMEVMEACLSLTGPSDKDFDSSTRSDHDLQVAFQTAIGLHETLDEAKKNESQRELLTLGELAANRFLENVRSDDPRSFDMSRNFNFWLSRELCRANRLEDAIEFHIQTVDCFLKNGADNANDYYVQDRLLNAYLTLAGFYVIRVENHSRAIEWQIRAIDQTNRMMDRFPMQRRTILAWQKLLNLRLTYSHGRMGNLDLAHDCLEACLRIEQQIQELRGRGKRIPWSPVDGIILSKLADVYVEQGELKRGHEHYQKSFEWFEKNGDEASAKQVRETLDRLDAELKNEESNQVP